MRTAFLLLATLVCLFSAAHATAAEGDIAGSSDYPLIGRFQGSTISYYDVKDFDEYHVFTGPVKKEGNLDTAIKVEGKTYRIAYKAPKQHSLAEIFRNFEIAFADAGFDVLFKCEDDVCGLTKFSRTIDRLPLPYMVVDSWDYRYLAGRLARAEGDLYATLFLSKSGNGDRVFQLTVVEVQGMKNRMIGAEEMAQEIAVGGAVALYGIYFDTNSATLKPESQPTLDEIGKLMRSDRSLKLIIVGHTDNQGTLEHNLDLSNRRAAAVVEVLVKDYKVERDRLTSSGAAFLAPVATNDTEEGRAKNRRVELVKQ